MALKVIIGIDVETTSLDPSLGEIIDVAAIKYDWATGEEVARLEQLCKPTKMITAEISALTGITNEMVAGSPNFKEIVSRLREFVGGDPLFAHNAEFDTRWLTYHGLNVATNHIYDSYLLATIAYPEVPSYNLGMLSAQLGLTIDIEHRAAADVELTWKLLRHIKDNLGIVPEQVADVRAILDRVGGNHYSELFTPLETRLPASRGMATAARGGLALTGFTPMSQPSHPNDASRKNITIADALAPGGLFEQRVHGFSPREGQLTMANTVLSTFKEKKLVLIEAGTGTGKTYAYLVPAIMATQADVSVVISTYTKHLQDQLVEYDIPAVLAALGVQCTVAVAKGRSNYICDRRLVQLIRRIIRPGATATIALTEAFLIIKVIRWLAGGGSGDIEKLNLSHQGPRIVRAIHADSLVCRLQCKASGTCPYTRHKEAQQGAQITVVNHALLAQMAVSNRNLPDSLIIIDEAHHLEAAARKASELDLSLEHVQEVADSLVSLAQSIEGTTSEHIISESAALVAEYSAWLLSAGHLVRQNPRSSELRLTPQVRGGSAWRKLAHEATAWHGRLKFVIGLLRSLEHHQQQDIQVLAKESIRAGERLGIELENFVAGSSERIQWIGVSEGPRGLKTWLHDVALSLTQVLQPLLSSNHGIILTSATLTTRGSFGYIRERLGIESGEELVIPAPFKYREDMLIYLVDDGPLPSDKAFDMFVYKAIGSLAMLLRGRLLALFTSQYAVKIMYQMLNRDLYKAKIKLYAQKMTGGRHNMLDKFRKNPESVLLGTLSFWEGIDIPGDSLSCVVIPKLSFPSPEDPQLNAIAASESLNAFNDLFIPQMILRLRQGVGRLLRSSTDRGVVVILDPRLHRHRYGDEVLKSLPPATIHIGSIADLEPKVREWFGEEKIKEWGRENQ